MAQIKKLYLRVMSGKCDNNISFEELRHLIESLGFKLDRVKGDHFIYIKDGVDELLNVQPIKNMAKPYQVEQLRRVIKKYGLEV